MTKLTQEQITKINENIDKKSREISEKVYQVFLSQGITKNQALRRSINFVESLKEIALPEKAEINAADLLFREYEKLVGTLKKIEKKQSTPRLGKNDFKDTPFELVAMGNLSTAHETISVVNKKNGDQELFFSKPLKIAGKMGEYPSVVVPGGIKKIIKNDNKIEIIGILDGQGDISRLQYDNKKENWNLIFVDSDRIRKSNFKKEKEEPIFSISEDIEIHPKSNFYYHEQNLSAMESVDNFEARAISINPENAQEKKGSFYNSQIIADSLEGEEIVNYSGATNIEAYSPRMIENNLDTITNSVDFLNSIELDLLLRGFNRNKKSGLEVEFTKGDIRIYPVTNQSLAVQTNTSEKHNDISTKSRFWELFHEHKSITIFPKVPEAEYISKYSDITKGDFALDMMDNIKEISSGNQIIFLKLNDTDDKIFLSSFESKYMNVVVAEYEHEGKIWRFCKAEINGKNRFFVNIGDGNHFVLLRDIQGHYPKVPFLVDSYPNGSDKIICLQNPILKKPEKQISVISDNSQGTLIEISPKPEKIQQTVINNPIFVTRSTEIIPEEDKIPESLEGKIEFLQSLELDFLLRGFEKCKDDDMSDRQMIMANDNRDIKNKYKSTGSFAVYIESGDIYKNDDFPFGTYSSDKIERKSYLIKILDEFKKTSVLPTAKKKVKTVEMNLGHFSESLKSKVTISSPITASHFIDITKDRKKAIKNNFISQVNTSQLIQNNENYYFVLTNANDFLCYYPKYQEIFNIQDLKYDADFPFEIRSGKICRKDELETEDLTQGNVDLSGVNFAVLENTYHGQELVGQDGRLLYRNSTEGFNYSPTEGGLYYIFLEKIKNKTKTNYNYYLVNVSGKNKRIFKGGKKLEIDLSKDNPISRNIQKAKESGIMTELSAKEVLNFYNNFVAPLKETKETSSDSKNEIPKTIAGKIEFLKEIKPELIARGFTNKSPEIFLGKIPHNGSFVNYNIYIDKTYNCIMLENGNELFIKVAGKKTDVLAFANCLDALNDNFKVPSWDKITNGKKFLLSLESKFRERNFTKKDTDGEIIFEDSSRKFCSNQEIILYTDFFDNTFINTRKSEIINQLSRIFYEYNYSEKNVASKYEFEKMSQDDFAKNIKVKKINFYQANYEKKKTFGSPTQKSFFEFKNNSLIENKFSNLKSNISNERHTQIVIYHTLEEIHHTFDFAKVKINGEEIILIRYYNNRFSFSNRSMEDQFFKLKDVQHLPECLFEIRGDGKIYRKYQD